MLFTELQKSYYTIEVKDNCLHIRSKLDAKWYITCELPRDFRFARITGLLQSSFLTTRLLLFSQIPHQTLIAQRLSF